MQNGMEKRYLSIKEVAVYTGISVGTLYHWSREGKIPVVKVSNLLRFDKVRIDKWMNEFERESINADLLQNN